MSPNELNEDGIGLVLNDDVHQQFMLLLLYGRLQNDYRSNEKIKPRYELNFEIAADSSTFLFPFYKVYHANFHLFFRPSYLLFTLTIYQFLATSWLQADSYFLFAINASCCSCSLFLRTFLSRLEINLGLEALILLNRLCSFLLRIYMAWMCNLLFLFSLLHFTFILISAFFFA